MLHMKKIDTIYIRKETRENEYRTPIVPNSIQRLREMGFCIYVESSKKRCFGDDEYLRNGAFVTTKSWIDFPNAFIIGIKELEDGLLDKMNGHVHLYFAHCYKNQRNSKQLLEKFVKTSSFLYDLEYFKNSQNKRVISFCHYAGIAGCALGLLQYFTSSNSKGNQSIQNIKGWTTTQDVIDTIYCYYQRWQYQKTLSVAIIGAKGLCAAGVKCILDFIQEHLHISIYVVEYTRDDVIRDLEHFDIVYNCIYLSEKIDPWFTPMTVFENKIVIVDISCDYNHPYNPIAIYNTATTFENPVYKYSENVDIIAIDNLPSLISYESSEYFSEKLVQLLELYMENHENEYWRKNRNLFFEKTDIINKKN